MKLTVVIPAFNEEETIASVIEGIPRRMDGIDEVEIITIDDGSIDKTRLLAEDAGAFVVSHPINKGVGVAFQTGIKTALTHGADMIVNIDGDGQFSPGDIPKLIEPILQGKAEFATCTRFAKEEYIPQMPWGKKIGNKMMAMIINRIIWDRNFTDVSCGFRAYSRDAALKLNLFGDFTYTQESFIDLASKGVAMTEVPLRVRGTREFGKSRVANNLFKYGMNAFSIILKSMRDIRPLTFFGSGGIFIFVSGILQALFVFGWWLHTGGTSGFKSVLIGSAVCLILGLLLGILALIADMIGRQRKVQEEILYYMRKAEYSRNEEQDAMITIMTEAEKSIRS